MDVQAARHLWPLLRFALDFLWLRGLRGPICIADEGCGFGSAPPLIHEILSSGMAGLRGLWAERYLAIDNMTVHLDVARSRAQAFGLDAMTYEFDLDTGTGALPPENQADLSVCSMILTHLRDPQVGLLHAARVTRPGGLVVVADAWYEAMQATGDPALVRACDEIKAKLPAGDFSHLDEMGARVGLRRVSGIADVVQTFGPGELDPKRDALGFVDLFPVDDPARRAWTEVTGGSLQITYVRRAYIKTPPDGSEEPAGGDRRPRSLVVKS